MTSSPPSRAVMLVDGQTDPPVPVSANLIHDVAVLNLEETQARWEELYFDWIRMKGSEI